VVAKIIRHKFQSVIVDSGDTTIVRPQSNWDGDAHDLRLGGRSSTGSATDTIDTTADELSLIKVNRGTATTLNIAAPGGGFFPQGWMTFIRNIGAGLVTLTAPSAIINYGFGTTTSALAIRQNEDVILISNGSTYDALCSSGSIYSRAGQLPGTAVNDNAAAGNVGEVVSASISSMAIPSDTPTGLTAVTLTAGDWDVDGAVAWSTNYAPTTVNYLIGCVNAAASMQLGPGACCKPMLGFAPFNYLAQLVMPTGTMRILAGGAATAYLMVQAGISGSILATGYIRARRAR
jgi:hypothetical protein